MSLFKTRLQRLTESLSNIPTQYFIIIGIIAVISLSVPMVYLAVTLLGEPYTPLFFWLSLALPVSITPMVLFAVIKILRRLKHFREALDLALEQNRKKELLLYEQMRFAFMGEMLSNISHQWRQPLNTINLALLSSKTALMRGHVDPEELQRHFDLIEANTHYLSNTIDDFKSFFQNRDTSSKYPLETILREVQSVMTPILDYNGIVLEVTCIDVDETPLFSPLSQVMLNLIGNSVDALKSSHIAPKTVRLICKKSEENLAITCCDNGSGIRHEHRDKIFNPYFSTKSKAQGTGIGLYMSRQIIEKMFNGSLKLADTANHNTCFEILMPFNTKTDKELQ